MALQTPAGENDIVNRIAGKVCPRGAANRSPALNDGVRAGTTMLKSETAEAA